MMNDDTKCLVMIAAYNEEENLARVVDQLITAYPQYDYVVINDGSTDMTQQICEKNHYNYINLPMNLGIGGAIPGIGAIICAVILLQIMKPGADIR